MKTSKRFYLLMASVFVITIVFFSSYSKDDEETPKKPDTAVDTPVTPPAPSGDTDEPEPSTPAGTGLGQGVKERIEIYLEGNLEKNGMWVETSQVLQEIKICMYLPMITFVTKVVKI